MMTYPVNFEEKIGFHHIREWLKEQCLSPLGIRKTEALSFLTSFDEIDLLTGQTHEFLQLCLMENGFPDRDFFDATPVLHYIAVPGTFPAVEDVFALGKALEAIREILAFFRVREQYPLLRKLTDDVNCFPDIVQAINKLLDRHGQVRDNASPALADIRREIASKQASVTRIMQRIIRQAQAEGFVDEGITPSVREGRTVIPVNSSFKRKINGIVHDESATGRTSYIEPAETVAVNNAIRELFLAEQREIVRILTAFADRLRPDVNALLHAFAFLGEIDFIRAKALLALKLKSVKPIFRNQQAFEWKKAVHPIMYAHFAKENREVVPLNIALTASQRILLISGPNAGGKSVSLKTAGLVQYMFQCGLLVPVSENSEMGLFDAIYIDIGDEQSIDNDLSTYSSHLLNMKYFVETANSRTLILIDEFGAGTEPTPGGAIAEAILSHLNDKGVWGIITTHYGNLKHYASSAEGIVNAAMLYDSRQMQPLFRIETGKPGSSYAFEIAKKTGLPESILADAADKAGYQHVDFEKYLMEIERDKRYWEQKRENIRQQEKRIDDLSARQLAELEKIEHERRTIVEKAKTEARQILADANRIIEQTVRTIKETQAERESVKTVRRELETFKEQIQPLENREDEISRKIAGLKERERKKAYRKKPEAPSKQPFAERKPEDAVIRKGDMVRVDGKDLSGEIVEISGKHITVAFGQLLSVFPAEQLIKISKGESRQRPVVRVAAPQMYDTGVRRQQFKSSIDVRGMRTDEALPKVEELVTEASMLNIGEVRILHGKGNGILRQMIRQFLKDFPATASFADEDIRQGGTGVTVVKVK
ncbi:MAG: Smr/MutS family protein [Bacteroidales bacterium]|jgi:DNA mismatch repair protein MutS2|nr:Smr/MutS family protein [Bacteroidales bacterium]